MNKTVIFALLMCSASPILAQNTSTNVNGSASGAEANSGSLSGASSDNQNANTQNGNVGVSVNENTSTSVSGAISGSESESESRSNSNQDQGQSQMQGQAQDQTAAQANEQGVTFNQTWNTKNRKTTEVRTNNAVPLTSSSSFSSDYCGGNVSGGASGSPIGLSIGMSVPKFDKSCQSLRRAEKFGMAAVNAANMGQKDLSGKLMSMMIWSICTSDVDVSAARSTASACSQLLLLGPSGPSTIAVATPDARVADKKGKITPEAAYRAMEPEKIAQATTNPPR